MKKVYLIGGKLSHSISPEVHKAFGGYTYMLKELLPEEIEDFVRGGDYDGLNVTVPYKKTAFSLMDELSDTARRTGAVNTVVKRNGKLFGDNTDYKGFAFLLKNYGVDVKDRSIIILGDGGAASTVRAVCIDLGAAEIKCFSHKEIENGVNGGCDIVVNCTPVGMYPNTLASPADLLQITGVSTVIDLIYNPFRTRLLLSGEHKKITAINGLAMLVAQAAYSAKYFGGKLPDEADMAALVKAVSRTRRNIVLIGFGGSGKTTVAAELSKLTGRKLIDTDDVIVRSTGKSIGVLIDEMGEKEFREIERKVIAGIVGHSNAVIATGGGSILDNESAELLKQSGTLVFLKCSPAERNFKSRPLYKTLDVALKTYESRLPVYEHAADIIVENDHIKTARETALEILNEVIGD